MREYLESLLIAAILALIIRTFVVTPFKIPTGSMEPTLVPGDKIFVNRFIYRFQKPQRGDVIVFRYPENPRRDFIKRLVATGTETVEIEEGKIRINGESVDEPEIFQNIYYYNRGSYGAVNAQITVPEEHYFVLGDNSASSRDSRYWGFVPRKYLLGKAFVIWWPISRWGLIR
ncbi:MAG: signal peptidase I [Candidatus Omnitrophica bacterium]|nr:signal peptidase I [Candidatus Omnitrophota bacterium]